MKKTKIDFTILRRKKQCFINGVKIHNTRGISLCSCARRIPSLHQKTE